MLFLSILTLTSSSLATPCPWSGGIEDLSMGRNWLEINGGFYALNMPSEKLSLQRDFEACGLEDASLMLELWTRSKRRTNITALSGVFAPWLWAGTGVLSFVAAGQRTLLYDQLLSWSPEEPDTRLL